MATKARHVSDAPVGTHLEVSEPGKTGVPVVECFHDAATGTWQYLVADPDTLCAAIIDPVLDYDSTCQTVSPDNADRLLAVCRTKGYKIELILETHAHADHLTAASYLQSVLAREQGTSPPICIGKLIGRVLRLFGRRYGVPQIELNEVFDRLFDNNEVFAIGKLQAKAIHLPGHTPDHLGYLIGENIFCGDSVFNADLGTARVDFPGGSAKDLYKSTRLLLKLPPHYRIWTGHDYPPATRKEALAFMSVAEHRQHNKYLQDGVTEQAFTSMREERDAGLKEPKLLHQSLQVNIRGGRLPKPLAVTRRHAARNDREERDV